MDNEVLYPVTVVLWIGRRTRIGLSSTEGGDTHTTSHLDILHSQHGPCPPGLHVQPMSCKYNCPAKSGWVDGCLEVYSEAKLSQAVQPASQPASPVLSCPARGWLSCSWERLVFPPPFFFCGTAPDESKRRQGFHAAALLSTCVNVTVDAQTCNLSIIQGT